jgi:predicted metal-dependent hydrolase
MLPPEILDYVVAHELTHLKEAGHNRRFWRQVATVLPDYAHRRRWLNLYGTPFLTWQPSNY